MTPMVPPSAPVTVTVTVVALALAADLTGWHKRSQTLPAGATVADLLERLHTDNPRLDGLRGRLRLAVHNQYANPADALPDAAEVLLMPPVCGG